MTLSLEYIAKERTIAWSEVESSKFPSRPLENAYPLEAENPDDGTGIGQAGPHRR